MHLNFYFETEIIRNHFEDFDRRTGMLKLIPREHVNCITLGYTHDAIYFRASVPSHARTLAGSLTRQGLRGGGGTDTR
jgi:hypothetical protein